MITFVKKQCLNIKLFLFSIFLGIIVGSIDFIFGKTLIFLTSFRENNFKFLIPFLSISGLLIILIFEKIGKNSAKGMSLIFENANESNAEIIPKRLIPIVILTTWITHLFGGSAGREGVAVQIGAAISEKLNVFFKFKKDSKLFIIIGMAAGFSGLFQTPMAATFFALEVLTIGKIEYKALFPAIISSYAASFTSSFLGLEKFFIPIHLSSDLNYFLICKIIILGILFSLVGSSFAVSLKFLKSYLNKIFKNSLLRIFTIGLVLSILFTILHFGRYSGLGTNLISMSFNSNKIYFYDWFFKFLFTILTLSAGFQGGEVTPLFCIGSCFGYSISSLFMINPLLCSALGYASVFASATNTFIAPIFIGVEVFGFESLPYFFISCSISYFFNGNNSIYSGQNIEIV